MSGILQDNYWFSNENDSYGPGNTLRFRGAQSLLKSTTNTSNSTTFTLSVWVKMGSSTQAHQTIFSQDLNGSNTLTLRYGSTSTFDPIIDVTYGNNTGSFAIGRFRDYSAWYHLYVVANGSTMTVSVNNQAGTTVSQTSIIFQALPLEIGNTALSSSLYFEGYMAEYQVSDQVVPISAFAEYNTDGVWVPKAPSGINYGTDGFYLNFSDPADIGADSSGNGNDFTATGFNFADSFEGGNYILGSDLVSDSPTDNYFPYNPLNDNYLTSTNTANAYAYSGASAGYSGLQQLGPSTNGKYVIIGVGAGGSTFTRISAYNFYATKPTTQGFGILFQAGWYESGASNFYTQTISPAGQVFSGVLSSGSFGEQVGWAVVVDEPAGKYWLAYYLNDDPTTITYVDASVAANPTANPDTGTSPTGTFTPGIQLYYDTVTGTTNAAGPAIIAPYQSHDSFVPQIPNISTFSYVNNSSRLQAAPIPNPSDHFDVITDTGANILTAAQSKFSSGLWIVKDTVNTNNWQWVDSLNGNQAWASNLRTTFSTYAAPSGDSVAYCWKAEDSFTGTGITAGIRNVTAGFSIVKYTGDGVQGRAIPHGLGKVPGFMIVKANGSGYPGTTQFEAWPGYYGQLDSRAKFELATTVWPTATPPDSTNFYIGTSTYVNDTGVDYVAYIWAPIEGYSWFPDKSYFFNGTTDGPFAYTGMSSAWIMTKNEFEAVGGPWAISDDVTSPYNPVPNELNFNTTEALSSPLYSYDLLSNGFKGRSTWAASHYYGIMAFARSPFGGSNVAPATAR